VTDVVYVTHEIDPEVHGSHVDTDLEIALAEFDRAGLDWAVAAWDDHGFDWSEGRLVLVRSPWDYVLRRREFLEWTRDVESLTTLVNPAAVLEENTDKGYLRTLEARGVRIVPTGWVGSADDAGRVVARMRRDHGPRVVVKPTVSSAARGTIVTADALEAEAHARLVLAQGFGVLVQPYVDAVDDEGEISVVMIDGRATHAVRRAPALSDAPDAAFGELVPLTEELAAAASAVLGAAESEQLLYARVDLVREPAGNLALMELELTEPTLFLTLHQPAAQALAQAVAARLA
jgi:glutathione synthase/RimK-type ligase-like ATP-grasp enzyme